MDHANPLNNTRIAQFRFHQFRSLQKLADRVSGTLGERAPADGGSKTDQRHNYSQEVDRPYRNPYDGV